MKNRRILLGLTGSVASVLYTKLVQQLQSIGIVDVILTSSAQHFVNLYELTSLVNKSGGEVFTDINEWKWGNRDIWKKDDQVLHIELRNRSSALVIAPCSMNTLAKLANGLCDNLLTSVARAWDTNRPVVIAPAANTHMWNHPVTNKHINTIKEYNYTVIPPQYKMLACNTLGDGALANIDDIVTQVDKLLRWEFPIKWKGFSNSTMGIPVGTHPGSFKAIRKNSTHTGVDLYVNEYTTVHAVESGVVVGIEPFTGKLDNSPWWLDTDCVLVEGATGVICYGEVSPLTTVGRVVQQGSPIGRVRRVIPEGKEHPEIIGWKPNMLHMELYPHGVLKASNGYERDKHILRDPTPYLLNAYNAPSTVFNHPLKEK